MKRKDEGSSPAADRPSKKAKEEDEEPGALAHPYMAGRMEGPDDSFITGLFIPLLYAIIGFAEKYFKGEPYKSPLKAEHKAFFESLTSSNYKDYLTSTHPGAKERIVQAVVWNKLIEMLLQSPLKAFVTLQVEIIQGNVPDISQFHAWRAMTAQFFFAHYKGRSSWGKNGSRRQDFIRETTDLLLRPSCVVHRAILEKDLDTIAEHAYQLARAMARSGAHWLCTMEDPRIGKLHGFRMKSDRMSEEEQLWDNEEGRRLTVDLVAAPMLLRYGDSSGQSFEKCHVFRKAEVTTVPEAKPKKGKS